MTVLGRYVPTEIVVTIALIFGVIAICAITLFVLFRLKPTDFTAELIAKTKSWFFIAVGLSIVITAPTWVATFILAFISFVALREILSIGVFREADRTALFAAYFTIPVQYWLAYNNYYEQFLYFIPFCTYVGIAFLLVMSGKTARIGRSMSLIPSVLLLTVYMLSHIILLFNIDVPSFSVGPGGLIIYLVMLTAFNDVFQFTWGKLFGKRKILPSISPNKTIVGFVGGVLTTGGLAYFIHFLTPLSPLNSLIMGILIGVSGFVGDALISAIKRDLGIKDTDNLIPGHGGALDRLDSILIAAPVYYHMFNYFLGNI